MTIKATRDDQSTITVTGDERTINLLRECGHTTIEILEED